MRSLDDYSELAKAVLDDVNVKRFKLKLSNGVYLVYDGTSWEVEVGGVPVTTPAMREAMPEMVDVAWRAAFEGSGMKCPQCGGASSDGKPCSKECKKTYYTALNAARKAKA